MKKKKITGYFVFFLLCIIATIYDLRISQTLTQFPMQYYVAFGARVGGATALFVLAYCFGGFAKCQTVKWRETLGRIFSAGSLVVAAYMTVKPNLTNILQDILLIAAMIGYFIICNFLVKRVDGTTVDEKIFIKGILFVIVSTVVVNILKCIWARPRFYSLIDAESEFVPWYLLHPFVLLDDTLKSFPSGHTTSASAILFFQMLPDIDSSCKKHEKLIHVMTILWIIVTASSRVFGGYHFLSDTLAGFGITYMLFQLIVVRKSKDITFVH